LAKRNNAHPRRYSRRRLRFVVFLLSCASAILLSLAAFLVYHTLRFNALIDRRLQGEQIARPTWVYARKFEIRRGQRLTRGELVALLNDLGYRQQTQASLGGEPGSFALIDKSVRLSRRGAVPAPIEVTFDAPWVSGIRTVRGGEAIERVPLEPVPVTTLFGDDRTKKRWMPLDAIPKPMRAAVLATEDRRFFEHTGFDPIGIARALAIDLREGGVQQGASTLTQQLVKNYFLTPERSLKRKLLEAYLAVLLENRTSKNSILQLYLNDVYLGQRGSFGINGVGQAAQIFFGKNVKNVTVAEAALIAGVIRSPISAGPFDHPEAALARRNVVLDQMVSAELLSAEEGAKAKKEPLGVEPGTVDQGEAPYFIDALRGALLTSYDAARLPSMDLRVLSTMDRYLQNAAQSALVEGLEEIAPRLSSSGSGHGPVQAAVVAMDPSTGDVVALVGARSYGVSQFNRALEARRQPGSAFKPFVYLAAFENDPGVGPATTVVDEPTTFRQGGRPWTPSNYSHRFEGTVSFRTALARSLNVATAKVGEKVGFQRVVDLWESMGMSSHIEPYPSLVLGSFEVTPLELATAFAVLANGGKRVEPRFFTEVQSSSGKTLFRNDVRSRRVASQASTYLVTDMMESVVESGTAREIRARGLNASIAGKTGTTNDTRDAWFVGYTPELLAVVWVGYDDNRPLGLSGSAAALPIWTRFMKAAVSGREKETFAPPPGIVVTDIDPASGKRATGRCPQHRREVFRERFAPRELCPLHPG
jgi:penicillin-binding protein 1B